VAGLSLLLLIPVSFLKDTIRSRSHTAEEAISEVGSSWGGRQFITWPYIEFSKTVINQKEEQKKYLCVFPESFNADIDLTSSTLKRGIFKVPVYRSNVKAGGAFTFGEEVGNFLTPDTEARLCLSLGDLKGLEDQADILLGGQSLKFSNRVKTDRMSNQNPELVALIPEGLLNGKDSIEFVIATKELTDSLPEDCKKDDFRESFRYYPEFLHYFYTHKTNGDNYVSLTYHREERVKGKKATNEEEIRKLLLDYIAKQKGTKEYHVQYLIDEGKDFDQSVITFHSRKNKEKVHMEGTLYVLPGTGKEKIRNVEELRSMLKEFTTTHYAGYLNYHYVDKTFDMTECDRYTSQLMELTIGDERPWDSVANLFHVQIGNYWKGEGLKILMLKPINSSYFMPRLEWMEIKSIHNNEIEWLPGYEGGYLHTRE
jgi:hypothetical protein